MITIERLMDFDFNAYIALQVDMIQVVASKERWLGDLLPETLQEFGVKLFHFWQAFKNIRRTDE